jgi:ubiquitin-protein ligase/DNA-directed RNA polymerase subunit RPC12/RpoP
MISFACASCGKTFSVPPEFAGRTARCKGCGEQLTVPQPVIAPLPPVPQPHAPTAAVATAKLPMRTRRLMSDASAMTTAFIHSASIKVQPIAGDPPEIYRVQYSIQSLERGKAGTPIPRDQHEVEIQLTSEYPRISPRCKMLTPIFHPNIDTATICVGDHWTAGEQLPDLVIRIGQMIAFQEYNIRSPLDAEAAMWADLNSGSLPIDSQDLHPPE